MTRQVVGWFTPARAETVRYGEFPIFLVEGRRGMIYGFPDFEGRGVKAACHDHGPVAGADEWHNPPTDLELEAVGATLAEFLPLTRAAAPAAKPAPAPRVLTRGDICPKCKAEVRDRPLLNRSYLGCLC